MKLKRLLGKTVPLLLIVTITAFSAMPFTDQPAGAPRSVKVEFQEFKLQNGLRVILSEDHRAPTFTIAVTYNAGSRDEVAGRTGFAHLFEHMMFQGSENVGKGEHFALINNNGGALNGSTNQDRTNYYETLPANQLELALFLESDRMRSLSVNQANLDNQRQAVQEERRQRIDNQPFGRTAEIIFETAYDNFAYKHSSIGLMADLNAATVKDVEDFFKIYYAPNNAVLTLVGDFESAATSAKIKKYFENIPAQPSPPAPDLTEPEQQAERRRTIEDPFVQLPRIDINYKIPGGATADWHALNLLTQTLVTGLSARLYLKLVRGDELAISVSGGTEAFRGTSLLTITIQARNEPDLPELERLVYEELELIKKESVADWELQKVQMQLRRRRAQALYSTRTRALLLGQYAVYYNNPARINNLEEIYGSITKADVQRVARTFLKAENRTVIITTAKKAAPAAATAKKEQ